MSQKQSKKFIIVPIISLGISITVLAIMGNISGKYIDEMKSDQKDNYTYAIKKLDSWDATGCLDLISHLNDHYYYEKDTANGWNNYLSAEYDKAKSLGCSPLPKPIKELNPNGLS